MKIALGLVAFVATAILNAPLTLRSQAAPGQNLFSTDASVDPGAIADPSSSSDDNGYADGVRAINTSRWAEAIAIFTRVARQGGSHAEGALYWKAYAENKQGQSDAALETCSELRRFKDTSSWLDDCGAIEIEILASRGRLVPPQAQQSDNMKLLALASLMQHDEKRALNEIDEILNSNGSSEKLKQGAVFIMGQHHSDTVYPQIARLSLVDGDVRIARGQQDRPNKEAFWEEAENDLPLEAGYNIVTGEGRAEIELEDASTLYLAPNSVLTINALSSTAGIPHTEMALLSGTVTLHVRPYVFGETFILLTPTDEVVTRYPQTAYSRISSYTDGIAFTSIGGGVLGVQGAGEQSATPGRTLYFKEGHRVLDAGPIHPPDFTAWDQWVADRTATREQATAEALKQSGLSAPIPGLADLAGKGSFFPCEPYGTCWNPTENVAPQPQSAPAAEAHTTPEQGEEVSHAVADDPATQTTQTGRNIRFIGPPAASGPPSGPPPDEFTAFEDMFPCVPDQLRYLFPRYRNLPWAWAVCHSGSWIAQNNRYVWVVGRRHHHPSVHWIKYGSTVAFVPIHPRDVKDHLPVNRKADVFAVNLKSGHAIERLQFGNEHSIALMKEPPKELRIAALAPLPHVGEPQMEAHSLKEFCAAKGAPIKTAGTPITFSAKSQSFMMTHEVIRDGHATAVMTPMGNRGGDLQSHSGALTGSGNHGGGSSGGFHGGNTSSGSASAHSGGSSSSLGGGGSHSGGGSVASGGGASHNSGGSASSSPAGSAASPPAATHH